MARESKKKTPKLRAIVPRCKALLPPKTPVRTAVFQVYDTTEKMRLREAVFSTFHFQNLLLILLAENYKAYQEGRAENLRNLLLNFIVMRAVVSGAAGGQSADKVEHLKKAMTGNPQFADLLAAGKTLKEKNLAMLVKRVKAAFKSYFTKMKQGDKSARPPRPRKLAKLYSYSIPIDQVAFSFNTKNCVSINLNQAMEHFTLDHDKLLDVVGSFDAIQSLAVTYRNAQIFFSITYHADPVVRAKEPARKFAGLDLGLKNLAAIVVGDTTTPSMTLDGGPATTFNEKNNRRIAKHRSAADLLLNHRIALEKKLRAEKDEHIPLHKLMESCPELAQIQAEFQAKRGAVSRAYEQRHRYFKDLMHKASCRLLEHLKESQVTDLFVSTNLGKAKQDEGLSRTFNRMFHSIPIKRLVDMIQLKAAEYGIGVWDVDEAYSSAVSCMAGTVCQAQELAAKNPGVTRRERQKILRKADVFKGRRVARGLFRDAVTGKTLHADLNGACNHIRLGTGHLGAQACFAWLDQAVSKLQTWLHCPANSLFLDRRIGKEATTMSTAPPRRAHDAARLLAQIHGQICTV